MNNKANQNSLQLHVSSSDCLITDRPAWCRAPDSQPPNYTTSKSLLITPDGMTVHVQAFLKTTTLTPKAIRPPGHSCVSGKLLQCQQYLLTSSSQTQSCLPANRKASDPSCTLVPVEGGPWARAVAIVPMRFVGLPIGAQTIVSKEAQLERGAAARGLWFLTTLRSLHLAGLSGQGPSLS
jgi:hypothetical protein